MRQHFGGRLRGSGQKARVREKLPLIYIVGSSHSGSTLLDLLLGSHSSIESLGEAKKIPSIVAEISRGARPLCTCRQEVQDCPLWGSVLSETTGDLKSDPAANGALYRRILEASGKSFLLDSSKTLGRALMFARSDLFNMVFIQLVRDSRAVVFSSKRKRSRQQNGDYGLISTALGWQKLNARIQRRLMHKGNHRYMVLRYEDLTSNPHRVLENILGIAGLSWEPALMRYRESVHHNIEGNRMRMGTDSEIKRDEQYLFALGRLEWVLSTALTFRGLRRFGYSLKRSRAPNEAGSTAPSLR